MPGAESVGPLGWWLAGLLVCGLLAGVGWWALMRAQRPGTWGDLLRRDRPSRGYLGLTRRGEPLRPEESRRCQHTLVIGSAPQISQRYVQPNLLLDADEAVSVVIFDVDVNTQVVQPALQPALLWAFAAHHDVQVFAPFEETTLRFPLLAGLNAAGLDAAGPNAAVINAAVMNAAELAAAELAAAALHQPGQLAAADTAERRAELALLEGLLLDAAARLGGSLQAVLELVRAGPDALGAHLAGAARPARQRTHLYFSLRQEQQESVAAALSQVLAVFGDDRLDQATRMAGQAQRQRPGDELEIELALTQPVAALVRLPAELVQTPSGEALLRMLQHTVLGRLQGAGAALGGAPPQHVSVFLPGPAASSDPLPGWPARLAALRSMRVACQLLCPPEAVTPEPGLYGQLLRLSPAPEQRAELSLADGRASPVWLPSLTERRVGTLFNPLYEAARQQQSGAPQHPEPLTRDLLLRRLLTRRAAQQAQTQPVEQPISFPAPPERADEAAAPGLLTWLDQRLGANAAASTPPNTAPQVTSSPLPAIPVSTTKPPGEPEPSSTEPEPAPLEDDEAEFGEDGTDDGPAVFENPVEVRQERLLKLLAEHRDLTPAQVVTLTDLPETTVRRDLNMLEDSGLVTSARVAGKRRYRLLPPEAQGR